MRNDCSLGLVGFRGTQTAPTICESFSEAGAYKSKRSAPPHALYMRRPPGRSQRDLFAHLNPQRPIMSSRYSTRYSLRTTAVRKAYHGDTPGAKRRIQKLKNGLLSLKHTPEYLVTA